MCRGRGVSYYYSKKFVKFFKRNVQARFGVPQNIVTYNGIQFIDKRLKSFLEELKIKQHFTLIENPQTNG